MLKTASARFISNIMASLTNAIDIVSTSVINMQLKTDILNEAVNTRTLLMLPKHCVKMNCISSYLEMTSR